jgi:hypothetical protein
MDCCTAMRRGYAARVVAMIVALALLAHQAAAQGWQRGRVTYFGALWGPVALCCSGSANAPAARITCGAAVG